MKRHLNDRELFEANNISYYNFPVTNIEKIDFSLLEKIKEILQTHNGNILIYCASANRVGAILSLYLNKICGHPKDRSLNIGTQIGISR